MKPATRRAKAKRDPNRYPKGLNREKVQEIIDHYENQSDEEAIAETEAAYHNPATTMIEVSIALLPKIQKLLAKRAG
jgi:hypothetical protein